MKKRIGTTRTVFVFKNFVVKIPRLRLKNAIDICSELNLGRLVKHICRKGAWTSSSTINSCVAGGFMANWCEYLFWIKNRKLEILMPVYFSVGFISIQKAGIEIEIDGKSFKYNINKLTDNTADSHTFDNPKNFCLDEKGKLKVFDYGDPGIFETLKNYGEILRNSSVFSEAENC